MRISTGNSSLDVSDHNGVIHISPVNGTIVIDANRGSSQYDDSPNASRSYYDSSNNYMTGGSSGSQYGDH